MRPNERQKKFKISDGLLYIAKKICELTAREFAQVRFDGIEFHPNSNQRIHYSQVREIRYSGHNKLTYTADPNRCRVDGHYDRRYHRKSLIKINDGFVHNFRLISEARKVIALGAFTSPEPQGEKMQLTIEKFNFFLEAVSKNQTAYEAIDLKHAAMTRELIHLKKYEDKLRFEFRCDSDGYYATHSPNDEAEADRLRFLLRNHAAAQLSSAEAVRELRMASDSIFILGSEDEFGHEPIKD